MKGLWIITGRCSVCGQRLKNSTSLEKRVLKINKRCVKAEKKLGRAPFVQSCRKCNKLIIEGETGFVDRYLIIDLPESIQKKSFLKNNPLISR